MAMNRLKRLRDRLMRTARSAVRRLIHSMRRIVAAVEQSAFTAIMAFYRRDLVSRAIATVIYAAFVGLFYVVIAAHKSIIPEPWRHLVFISIVLRSLLSGLTIGMLLIPLLLVHYHDRRRKATAQLIHRLLHDVGKALAGTVPVRYVDDALMKEVIACASTAAPDLFIITPNGFYLCADACRQKLEVEFPTPRNPGPLVSPADCRPRADQVVHSICDFAELFRTALRDCPGRVHVIIPDTQDPIVASNIGSRPPMAGIRDEDLLRDVNVAARDHLTTIHSARRGATEVKVAPFLPELRLMLASEQCFIQVIPRTGLGIMEPVVVVSRQDCPDHFATLVSAMRVLCNEL